MINLQNSKKLLRTYDELLANVFPVRTSQKKMSKLNQTLFEGRSRNVSQVTQEKSPERKESTTIKIEFEQNQRIKQNQEIRFRRKMLTSSQKFYHQKKNAYSNYIKEIYSKINEELKKKNNFLTIGTHAIRKMDYAASINAVKQQKLQNKNNSLKQRLKDQLSLATENKQEGRVPFENTKSILVLKQLESKKPNLTYASQLPSERGAVVEKKMDRTFTQHPSKAFKSLAIEQYIPIRKSANKKQPFVFGMHQKQQNFEKLREKLLTYQDFLWKVNYSNGLYVKTTDNQLTYRAYIGPGNNSNLVKGILRRRFWWTISDKNQNCNFVFTQLKVNALFKEQQCAMIRQKYSDLNETLDLGGGNDLHSKIFNPVDLKNWLSHYKRHKKAEALLSENTYKRRASFIGKKQLIRIEDSSKLIMHNHLEQNYFIGNKKALYYNMKKFYQLQGLNVFEALPLTFHIIKGIDDPQYKNFLVSFGQFEEKKKKGEDQKNVWILKPGQNSNRGNGITVCHSLDDIRLRLRAKQRNSDGSLRTFILQKYLQKPLLYKGRKFDIRHYLLLTCFNGITKAYWYPEGYIRTSSSMFSLKRGTNLYIHLTNDAIQKHSDEYGKYQKGNKVSYEKFENYLSKTLKLRNRSVFFDQILPSMKQLTINAVKSTYLTLDQKRHQHNFQILGMDFMIDENLKPWLIEINTNPCLQMSSPLLARIIPSMVQNAFRLCVDPFFPPPDDWPSNRKMFTSENPLEENLMELIFDQSVEGAAVQQLYQGDYKLENNIGKIEEDAQIYENDGVEEWEGKDIQSVATFG